MSDPAIHWPAPTMPTFCYRALFGVLVDVLFEMPREFRHAVIDVMGGLTTRHFVLAIHGGRVTVAVRPEDDGSVSLIVSAIIEDLLEDVTIALLSCPSTLVGADPDLLMQEQRWRLEDALREIVGDQP